MNKYSEIIESDVIINKIKPFLKNKNAYIVGGYIRDVLMGKSSPDRDLIVCETDIKSFCENLAKQINAHFIELDGENKIYRLVLEDKINYLDITVPIENSLEKDLKRRDLTINSVAYDINNGNFIDITGGIEDIKNGIIKGIYEKNFEDDPLRLLRIFRFHSKTGFKIDNELINLTKKSFKDINKPAKERITVELLKMFEGKYCDTAILQMDECNLLEEIFPIYGEVKKIPPNAHHHLDLLHHSIETVNQIQKIYETSNEEIKEYLNTIKYAGVKELAFLKFAGFLHDIGKPSCWTIEENTSRHRFIKHDDIGSNLAVPILKDLKFSKKQIQYIKTLIKYHIYPSSLIGATDVTDKAYMKFYRKMEGFVPDVIILAMADRLSARGEAITEEIVTENINGLTRLLNNYLEQRKNIKPLEKLIDGNEIMEILNIQQSPVLGKLINELKEAQLSGNVSTKEEAREFIKVAYKSLS